MSSKRRILALVLLLMTSQDHEAATTVHFKLIRDNGKTYTSENIQRNEDLEFPRKDDRILQILHAMWENYYICLKEKEKKETKPEIRRLLEGQSTELQCDFCPRPFQNYEEIQWKFKPLSPESNIKDLEYLDLIPEMTLTTRKTLQIFNVIKDIAGLYVCYQKKNVLSVYVLEVSKNDTIEKVDTLQFHHKHFRESENNFFVHYQWTDYTQCNNICGKVGKKFKYGTCFVSFKPKTSGKVRNRYKVNSRMPLKSLENLDKSTQSTLLLQTSIQEQKIQSPLNGDNSTLEVSGQNFGPKIIKKFLHGIPCASPYLPKVASKLIKNFTAVKAIVKYCSNPCQENRIFEVIDNYGKVIETANNSAGIYSLYQKLSNLPPRVERRSIVAEFGSSITIQCPGTLLTNISYVWMVNRKIIYPEIIGNESNGRFTVDLVNRIHIKKLRLKDSQIFSCWQKGLLVGTVHLNVEKKFGIGFNHRLTLIGIVAIIGIFLMVGSKVLTRELKMRKK